MNKVELTTLVIATCGLALIVGLRLSSGSRHAHTVECGVNLKNIYVAYETFATAHDGPPSSVPSAQGGTQEYATDPLHIYKHFQALCDPTLLNPGDLVCPRDARRAAYSVSTVGNSNLSYFISVSTGILNEADLLAGNRNVGEPGTLVSVGRGTRALGWRPGAGLHDSNGWILLRNGSVTFVDSTRLDRFVANSRATTNWLAVP